MTEPTTPTGKAVYYNRHEDGTPDIFINWLVKAEREAAAAERERLIAAGWHEPRPDCGPIKEQPHEHDYYYATTGTQFNPPPLGVPCIGCGHPYGDPEAPTR